MISLLPEIANNPIRTLKRNEKILIRAYPQSLDFYDPAHVDKQTRSYKASDKGY